MKTLTLCLIFTLPLAAKEAPPAPPCAAAASQFLDSLDPAQRAKASMPLDAGDRENFRYTPQEHRAGLPLKEMTDAQREAVMRLLDSALSEKGKLKVTQIMSLESVLAEIEKRPDYRDPTRYFVSIFGTPGDPKGWGWRFEGHHLSLSFTLVEGKKVSLTPSFLGSNPGEVREGPRVGLKVLAAEEELSRTLVTTLLSDGKSSVIFSEKPPTEILSAESRKATALDPVGLSANEMSETQRTALLQLVSEYTGRYRKEFAEADMEKIKNAGIDKIRFGWSGGIKPGEAYYYRVQGPTFLIEAVNSQNNANHLHAAWRDFEGDHGRDILAEHIQQEH
ncbi:MAG: DUF3500 domain-containing protein [Luteolibacter sp.]